MPRGLRAPVRITSEKMVISLTPGARAAVSRVTQLEDSSRDGKWMSGLETSTAQNVEMAITQDTKHLCFQ